MTLKFGDIISYDGGRGPHSGGHYMVLWDDSSEESIAVWDIRDDALRVHGYSVYDGLHNGLYRDHVVPCKEWPKCQA